MKIGQLYKSDCLYSFRSSPEVGVLIDADDVVMVTDIRKRLSEGFFGLKQADVYFLHTAWNSDEAKVHHLDNRTFKKYFTKAKKRVK